MLLPVSSESPLHAFNRLISSFFIMEDGASSPLTFAERPGVSAADLEEETKNLDNDVVINNFGMLLALVSTTTDHVMRANPRSMAPTIADLLFAVMYRVRVFAKIDPHFRRRWTFFVHACLFRWAEKGVLDLTARLPFFADAPEDTPNYALLYVEDRAIREHPHPFLALLFDHRNTHAQHLGHPHFALPLATATMLAETGKDAAAARFALLACMRNPSWTRPDIVLQLETALKQRGGEPWRLFCADRVAQLDAWISSATLFHEQFVWFAHGDKTLMYHSLSRYLLGVDRSDGRAPRNCTLRITLVGLVSAVVEVVAGTQFAHSSCTLFFPSSEDLEQWWLNGPTAAADQGPAAPAQSTSRDGNEGEDASGALNNPRIDREEEYAMDDARSAGTAGPWPAAGPMREKWRELRRLARWNAERRLSFFTVV